MKDSDQPAAATGPHRHNGDNGQPAEKQSLWGRLRAMFSFRAPSLREDLAEALGEETSDTTAFSENERAILKNVLNLADMRVHDVMVPRADIEAVEEDETMAELIARFHHAGHSRLPVYVDNLDTITGFVHIKDVLQRLAAVGVTEGDGEAEAGKATVRLLSPVLKQRVGNKDMVRKILFVPPSMPVGDLLQQMQATRMHMAMVVDEYGGTDGLVTIEDLLEAVVGDIEDEYDDEDETLLTRIDDNTFVADARIEITELKEAIGADFDPGEHAEDADTLGGLILDLCDRIPVRGEVVTRLKGFEFEILQADARRIRKVRIVRRRRPQRVRPRPREGVDEPTPPSES